jgi:hypothetical protein
MSWYDLLLLVHVLAAMTWVGGGVMLSLMASRVRQSQTGSGEFARLLPFVGLRVLMPAVILVLATGIAMVLVDSAWSFRQPWVLAALGLFAAAFLVGAVYLSRIGVALGGASAPGGSATELRTLLDRWLAGYIAVLAVLLLAVAGMVFKPGS